ncbi:FAD-binding oxidoreductase [Microvirga sesbaniae]|uniref:FAD-binding oxidoreductase n=1 Tax=Microvirga sesbaniae TaxID=681392 RepID=UPI0021C9F052|nr:FAD-binding oxidoreductase [Microvirga sp. HBU67692]
MWRQDYRSWGRTVSANHVVDRPENRDNATRALSESEFPVLAYGCGRSYGDVALNPGGRLIDCRSLDRFLAFNRATGVLTCEAGVRLADILAVICRPEADGSGWFLPVTPGTRFVTVGGAIANDVHGKNHHRFGTFGRHVLALELARSDGSRLVCSPEQNPDLFAATIGGLGLTGLILSATLQLRRVEGLAVEAEDIQFSSLSDFFDLAEASDRDWEYTAAWVDCLASGAHLGRGIYSRARHYPGKGVEPPGRNSRLSIPITSPIPATNSLSVRAFNALYWRKLGLNGQTSRIGSYEPVFYPLDAIGEWNRLYGPKGFYQFQCVVPHEQAREAVADMLRLIAQSGEGSMLVVLKTFGDLPSPGLLSFPRPGVTLALDFPERGTTTRKLLRLLEEVAVAAYGRLYPAKDSLMTPDAFRQGYPSFEQFQPMMDPRFSSAFAQRIGLIKGEAQL